MRIVEFLSRRVVIECVSSLAYPNLISCSPARTSRSSLRALTAPATSGLCSLIWILHFTVLIIQFLAVTPVISSKNRACILASDSRNHMVAIFVHPLLPCRSAPLQADSPQHAPSRAAGGLLVLQRRSHLLRCAWRSLTSCHQPSSLSLGVQILGVLQALLMIDSSSITLFLCASLGPWCSHDIIRESSVHHCLLAERCQSTHSS